MYPRECLSKLDLDQLDCSCDQASSQPSSRMKTTTQVLRLDLQHEETHAGGGGRPHPRGTDTIVPGSPEDTPQSRAESFRKLYDTFLFLALACSMLEAVVFRFGRRHIIGAEQRRRYRRSGWGGADVGLGGGGMVSINGLESLLDEEDVRESARGWEDWRGETVQQVLVHVCVCECVC